MKHYSTEQGHHDASEVDALINHRLQEFDPTVEANRAGYLVLIRTLHTTLNIIRPQVGLNKVGSHISTMIIE